MERALFQLLQFSRQRQSFSAHRAAPMKKTDLIFPAFFSKFVDGFIPREATLEAGLTVAWTFSTNHNSLPRIVTDEIASFCIDHRLRQMAFFHLHQSGQRPSKGRLLRYVEVFRFHVAVRLFSNRSQKTSKCGKNISDTLASLSPRVPLSCSYRILTSSVIYYRTDARQHGIYLLKR